jgi:hypothetical protein
LLINSDCVEALGEGHLLRCEALHDDVELCHLVEDELEV